MNIHEVEQFHSLAQMMDPERIQPMDEPEDGSPSVMATAWQMILEDVPFSETRAILQHLYGRPQMLVLQPGHVVEAWEEVREDRAAAARELLEDCPSHPGQKLPHCRSCRADALVSGRARPVARRSKAVDRPSQSAGAFFVPKEVD